MNMQQNKELLQVEYMGHFYHYSRDKKTWITRVNGVEMQHDSPDECEERIGLVVVKPKEYFKKVLFGDGDGVAVAMLESESMYDKQDAILSISGDRRDVRKFNIYNYDQSIIDDIDTAELLFSNAFKIAKNTYVAAVADAKKRLVKFNFNEEEVGDSGTVS